MEEKMKKISIIVPVYGVEEWLARCLDSLVNQTLQDLEIIVVNDGSQDNSQTIIDEYEKKYPDLVKGYQKQNGGLSDARNYGMKYATGEYIAFVDSDDYVDTTMYEKLYQKAKEDNADAVTCAYYKVNEKQKSKKSAQKGEMHLFGKNIRENTEMLIKLAPYAWNKLIRREVFEKSGLSFPKGLIFEDLCTMYPLLLYCNKVSKVDEELYYYIEQREGSIINTFSQKKMQVLDALTLLNKRFQEAGEFEDFHDELVTINLRHTYYRFKEFHLYKKRGFQFKFVHRTFKHLKKYFPDWRENYGYFPNFTLPAARNAKRWLYKRSWYWYMVALLPLPVIKFGMKIDRNLYNKTNLYRYCYIFTRQHSKIDKKMVLFESFHGKKISDSPLAMLQELLKEERQYKIYYTVNKANYKEQKQFIKNNHMKIRLVKLKSFKYQRIIAKAGYLINNVSFPPYFIKKEGQIYMNTWHGTPLKTLGKNMCQGIESMHNIQHNFLQSDYLLFPNEFTKNHMMEDYNLEQLYTGKTIVCGYPRNSVFMDENAGKRLKAELGYDGKTLYTYMPTWRGKNSYQKNGSDYIDDIEGILTNVDQVLTDNEIFFVNLHPNVNSDVNFDSYKHIQPFPTDIPQYDFINCTDVLITDYSSIFFDFSITKKPIVLFMYDYDEYMEERGMYTDVKELPFTKVYNLQDFIKGLKGKEFLKSTYSDDKEYHEKYIQYDSLDAAKYVNEVMFDQNFEHVKVEDYSHNKKKPWKLYVFQERVDNKEDLDRIYEENKSEDTIFAIRLHFFDAKMNQWFYSEYNKKMTYIIYSYHRVLTWYEVKQWNRHNEKFRKIARERGYQRSLPNIMIINKDEIRNVI